jgi:hypothetical protein
MDYGQFIGSKLSRFHAIGFEPEEISEHLFDFQSALVRWALRIGRCALFADTGLGKTRMQLAWADAVLRHEKKARRWGLRSATRASSQR